MYIVALVARIVVGAVARLGVEAFAGVALAAFETAGCGIFGTDVFGLGNQTCVVVFIIHIFGIAAITAGIALLPAGEVFGRFCFNRVAGFFFTGKVFPDRAVADFSLNVTFVVKFAVISRKCLFAVALRIIKVLFGVAGLWIVAAVAFQRAYFLRMCGVAAGFVRIIAGGDIAFVLAGIALLLAGHIASRIGGNQFFAGDDRAFGVFLFRFGRAGFYSAFDITAGGKGTAVAVVILFAAFLFIVEMVCLVAG